MTSPAHGPWPTDEGIVTEDELRRYIRHASVLIASAPALDVEALLPERIRILRRAAQWLESTSLGIAQLLHQTEHQLTKSDTLDEPLTAPLRPATMPTRSSES